MPGPCAVLRRLPHCQTTHLSQPSFSRVFDAEVIELCVRWYISYRLSYRDLVEIMAERGIQVAHTTILRWVLRYVPEYEKPTPQ